MPNLTTYQKLTAIQSELKAPKNQYNSFGGYAYRSCEDILEAVKPLLKKYNAVIINTDEIVMVGERYYVKATSKFINAETGETLINSAFAREEETKKGMDASQITGSTSSYARKYSLSGLLAIEDTKDSDGTNTHGKDEGEEKPEVKDVKLATPKQIEVLAQVYTGANLKKLLVANNINSLDEMPMKKASELIEKLKKKGA